MMLTTERLILRPFKKSDFEDVYEYSSNSENVKYMIWGPNNEEDTRNFINDCMQAEKITPRKQYDFAVVHKESGKVIGGCGLYLNIRFDEAMLGWILNKDYWKQGYGAELGKALIKYGFENLKLHRVYATCNAENYGSYRVMEKCGMRREAHFIKNRFGRVGVEEIWYDEFHYAILDVEYDELAKL